MKKKIASLAAFAVLASGLLLPTGAAFASSSITANPVTGSTLDVADTVGTDLNASPQDAGTYDVAFEQTWEDSSVVATDVNTPLGWDVEYLIDGSWVDSSTADLSDAVGVRSVGQFEATAISDGNQVLTEHQVAGDVTPGVGSIASSGRGDGWDVILTPDYLVNVFHHNDGYELECHFLVDGALCDQDSVYIAYGYHTSQGSGGAYYDGKIFSYVVRLSDAQTGVICTDITALPFTDCGFTATGSGGTYSATDYLGTQATVGTKIYVADSNQGKLLCFDMATATECSSITLPDFISADTEIDSYLVNIDGLLYLAAAELWCFIPATSESCSVDFPVALDSNRSNVIPMRSYDSGTQMYTLDGVCTFWAASGPECFDLSGTTMTVPAGFAALIADTPTSPAGGVSYFQTTAWNEGRVFWVSNEYGYDWDLGYLTCYDYATDAACADWLSPVTTESAYAAVIDSTGTCIWTNGDEGIIGSNSALTGEAGCTPPGASAEFTFDAAPSCTATGAVIGLNSLVLTLPVGVNATDLTLKVFDSTGVFTGFDTISLTGANVDLTTIDTSGSDGVFHFQIASEVATVEELELVTASLSYIGEPLAMCVTLAVVPDCPADLTGIDIDSLLPQSDFNVASSLSVKEAGVGPVISSQYTYSVNDYAAEGCAQWYSMMGPSGGIQSSGNGMASVVDFLWTPDGTMYVGGYFFNAGGDAAADYIAKWDGTGWSAVAPVDESTSAIDGRIATLAMSPDGKTLYVGGAFENVAGDANIDCFAVLDIATDTWSAGNSSYDFWQVRDIAVDPNTGALYVGGTFSDKLVLVDIENDTVEPVGGDGAIDRPVLALEFGPDGNLYAGGQFSDAGGDSDADYAAMWDGTQWSAINDTYASDSGFSDYVTAFAFADGKIYVAGFEPFVAEYSAADSQWNQLSGLSGSTRSIAVSADGTLYAAGDNGYSNAPYFARYVEDEWITLPVFDFASGSLQAESEVTRSWGDWSGAWNVDFSPTGDLWYGGDFTSINGDSSYAYLAHWGSPFTFGGSSISTSVPSYVGPVVTHASNRSPAKGVAVTLYGKNLSSVTKVTVGGVSLQVVSVSDTQVVVIFPVDMQAGKYDANLTSSFGLLSAMNVFEFGIQLLPQSDSFKVWTSINEPKDTVGIYAKEIIGLGKVQFLVDGKEIAWVRAVDSTDPKLRTVNNFSYLVRKINLHEGKNRFEIKIGGVRVWRTTYVPEN